MSGPTFNVSSGTSERDALWLESGEGLSTARVRIEDIAAVRPSEYFLYSPLSDA